MLSMRIRWVLVLGSILTVVGCSKTTTTPTGPTVQTPVLFASRLQVGGSAWKSFTNATAGTVTVQLNVLTPDTGAVRIGLGTFSGSTCTITATVDTPAGDTPQLSTTLAVGNYCVQISDIGNLTKLNNFAIVIVLP